jgi:UDP-3-O-[3-hydroxymyristoyl] glucosamine N-acyltransferase
VSWRLKELAERVGARAVGEADCPIDSVASLHKAKPGSITFLADLRYKHYLPQTRASAVILSEADAADCPTAALISDNPYLTFAKVAELLHPQPAAAPGVHPSAVVAPDCRIDPTVAIGPQTVIEPGVVIGAGVVIGPGCTVGQESVIGDDSRLVARVTLCRRAVLGRRVIVHPGAVIGSDGFGLAKSGDAWVKIPQLGRAVIGDDVEIGANTTIDCGTLEDTVLEEGVKLDNQIQIAHNVRIGAHTAIAGCVGIAGSARIGRHCTIAGAAGIEGHLEIADHVHITGMSKVSKSIMQPGTYTSGTPLEPNAQWLKNSVRFRNLDELARKVNALEKQAQQAQRLRVAGSGLTGAAQGTGSQQGPGISDNGTINLNMVSAREVMRWLPHRYPFLLIDRVLECKPGDSLTAVKNVTVNEPFFQGHFPGLPLMPGVLILEALAQASGVLAFNTPGHRPGNDSLYLFVGIDKARFKRLVEPGDQLILHVQFTRKRSGYGLFAATARVGDELAASADLMCVFKELAR